jgi:multicomponent Na+:H+ antiporter subunit D
MIQNHLPALIVVIPLLAALLTAAVGWVDERYCMPLAVGALVVSFVCSVFLLIRVTVDGSVNYYLGGWSPPWGIAYRVDGLSGLVLPVISLVACLNLAGARKIVALEFEEKIGAFYALYLLFVTGLLGMVATGDVFNLYVLLEIASLTGYALIGIGPGRAALSGLNYIFMGTIGASFYLLGVGHLYLMTGTLNMVDIAGRLPDLFTSRVVVLAFCLCMTGLFMKMALFPLHAWLPNAYAHAPSVSAGLVAPLTTKVMIYVMIRMGLFVFTPAFIFKSISVSGVMVWAAVIAIVAGSLMALAQRRLKKMLTYVIIAEVGYMVGGFWLGNRDGIAGAILHIVNDAMMTLCVFLAVGIIVHKLKDDHFDRLQGIFRKMPVTMAAFVVGGLAIIGVPPTCGFFSKMYLVTGGLAAGQYHFVAALLFSSLVNAVLFFRVIEIGYFEPFAEGHHGSHDGEAQWDEASPEMLVPLLVAATGLVALGLYSGEIVGRIIYPVIPAVLG